ncbi:MAG: hypothetical protein Tsb009_11850 [Planctomycetaceae bacterium]
MGLFNNFWDGTAESFQALDSAEKTSLTVSLVASIVLVIVALIIRGLLAKSLRKNKRLSQEIRRRWLVQLRNITFLLILMGLIFIWADTLRALAVYILAVAVAFVIAMKEIIQCLTGSIMRLASRSFEIGDRIEIGDFRGDVIDSGALTTTILEIGPGELTHRLTGRAVAIPNSMFLDKPVINETYTDEFVLHVFKVPMKTTDDWMHAEQSLLAIATELTGSYLQEARKHFQKLGKREGLAVLSVDPRVTFSIPKAAELELIVRFAAPAREKGKLEQEILKRFLTAMSEHTAKKRDEQKSTGTVPPANASAEVSVSPSEQAASPADPVNDQLPAASQTPAAVPPENPSSTTDG